MIQNYSNINNIRMHASFSLELAALQYSLRVIFIRNLTVWQLAAIVIVSKVSSSADKICRSEAFSCFLHDHGCITMKVRILMLHASIVHH